MIAALIRLRTQARLTLPECAELIGVSTDVCARKARELSLNAPVRVGRPVTADPTVSRERRLRLQREWKSADRQRRPDHYRTQAITYYRRRRGVPHAAD